MSSRLEEIRDIAALNPSDPFPRYGLALEYQSQGMHAEAHETFAQLEKDHPDYLAQYLMHGNLLLKMKNREEARAIFTRGVAVARRQGKQHALGELQAALDGLEEEEE